MSGEKVGGNGLWDGRGRDSQTQGDDRTGRVDVHLEGDMVRKNRAGGSSPSSQAR